LTAIGALAGDELDAALGGTAVGARYQPVVRISDRLPVALEVLARLDHPHHGMLSPEHFVPQMEDAGLARRLTERVAASAFADHARHFAILGLRLAVNFPLDVLLDAAALDVIDRQRQAAGIAAGALLIELTESRPLDTRNSGRMALLRAAIARLRRLGYGLAIDDFGPRMSELLALFASGFTAIKLDRAIVEDSATLASARRFLRETLAAAHAAGLTVIAEGVETRRAWNRMRALGVDQVQGFYVAHPLAAASVPAWIEAWRPSAA
jgi:EAL domain-containing protein (putative c-di-GMP-specific phosphodiesterase class I)